MVRVGEFSDEKVCDPFPYQIAYAYFQLLVKKTALKRNFEELFTYSANLVGELSCI
jgi:hypothetical protein